MKKLNKNFLIGAIVILILGVCVLLLGIFKFQKSKTIDGANTSNEINSGETEYKVNIDAKDCLTKEEADELIDWGDFKDNEKMIYIDNNEEHPIQVFKIKLKEGQSEERLMQVLLKSKEKFVEQATKNEEIREILNSQYGSTMTIGGDVITLIISNHLEEAREQTNEWLNS